MGKKGGKKKNKNTSNVFAMFEQSQIQEFKEAFGMIDANRDGFINQADLKATYESLGVGVTDSTIDAMIAEAPGQLNFTVFLNILADKLHGTDSEDIIMQAFKNFDPEGTGTIKKEYLGDVLGTKGDRFTPEEVESILSAAPTDADGNVDYKGLAYIITHGQDDEAAAEE
jgi:Ca2+-binding EF-hand superfamily protein